MSNLFQGLIVDCPFSSFEKAGAAKVGQKIVDYEVARFLHVDFTVKPIAPFKHSVSEQGSKSMTHKHSSKNRAD